jgi:uncharacterized cupin superfamily protein
MSSPSSKTPVAVAAMDVIPPARQTNYPEPFASRVAGRVKRRLGDEFGLRNFGVNLTRLAPGGISALRHSHSTQDEFIYVLEGTLTLLTDAGEMTIAAGYCAGFPAGGGTHQIVNRSETEAAYLEVGDRSPDDVVNYPDDDLRAVGEPGGRWRFVHKDGSPY